MADNCANAYWQFYREQSKILEKRKVLFDIPFQKKRYIGELWIEAKKRSKEANARAEEAEAKVKEANARAAEADARARAEAVARAEEAEARERAEEERQKEAVKSDKIVKKIVKELEKLKK